MKITNNDFVLCCKVQSPVVISLPHDPTIKSTDFDGIYKPREVGVCSRNARDRNTWQIAKGVNSDKPVVSIVRGLLPRYYLDYNRSNNEPEGDHAYFDNRLAYYWKKYHETIEECLSDAINRYGRAILIDLHGFMNQPINGEFDIILGTNHRRSVPLNTDYALTSLFSSHGYRTYCPTIHIDSDELYTGRFTIMNHSGDPRVDAIQVEIHRSIRILKARQEAKKISLIFRDLVENLL